MPVTMDQIKELRQSTGAGVLDCKKALEQTDGDMARAAEILREKGLWLPRKRQSARQQRGASRSMFIPGTSSWVWLS